MHVNVRQVKMFTEIRTIQIENEENLKVHQVTR